MKQAEFKVLSEVKGLFKCIKQPVQWLQHHEIAFYMQGLSHALRTTMPSAHGKKQTMAPYMPPSALPNLKRAAQLRIDNGSMSEMHVGFASLQEQTRNAAVLISAMLPPCHEVQLPPKTICRS